MFEYMIQGFARAGGIEVPPGRTVLVPRPVADQRPGPARRATGYLLQKGANALQAGARRLLEPGPCYRVAD